MGAINQPSLEALSRSREALRVRQENALRARHPQRETDIFTKAAFSVKNE